MILKLKGQSWFIYNRLSRLSFEIIKPNRFYYFSHLNQKMLFTQIHVPKTRDMLFVFYFARLKAKF